MAINVNTVYTTVLTILNKEQRGYLTPFEFNNIANQVQLQIFEKFFEDYNQYIRMPKTDVEFASRMDHIYEEFQTFMNSAGASAIGTPSSELSFTNVTAYSEPTDTHRMGSILYNASVNRPEIELVNKREFTQQILSPLTKPTINFPIGVYQQNKVTVYPGTVATPTTSDVLFNYIRKPLDPKWGYITGSVGQYVYDPSPQFSLVPSRDIVSSVSTNSTGITNATYTATVGTTNGVTTDGAGTGLTLSIVVTGNTITSVVVSSSAVGQGFKSGDSITITSALLTGANNSVIITIQDADINSANTALSQQFEISDSQQTEVILEILKYAGLIIRDPQVIQAASQELAQEEVNTKR